MNKKPVCYPCVQWDLSDNSWKYWIWDHYTRYAMKHAINSEIGVYTLVVI